MVVVVVQVAVPGDADGVGGDGLPPSSGAVQEAAGVPSEGTSVTPVGLDGACATGVPTLANDGTEVPMTFVATTVTE